MGCSDSNPIPVPNPENVCNPGGDNIGDLRDVPDSCFFTTEIGQFCGGAGIGQSQNCFGEDQGAGEWVKLGGGFGCGVCSSCKGIEQGSGNGLCGFGGGSCSWAGQRQRCRRLATNGDPLACCRRNRGVVGNLFCFDDNSKLRTCPNQFRGFSQVACIGQMQDYCSNDLEEVMSSKWANVPGKDCNRFAAENTGNLPFYGPVIGAMVNRYLNIQNNPITSSQSDGASHDPFIDRIVEICRENSGACDDSLLVKCQSIQREDLSTNVNLANLCGCFMEDVEYGKFSSFGIDRECDPVCTIGSGVKQHDPTTSNPARFKRCTQSICIIDDVTIDILAQSVVGDITFSQACGSCGSDGSGSCRCFITDTTIQAINSRIGDINFEQQCGGAPLCFETAPVAGAPPIEVNCNTQDPIDTSGGAVGGGGFDPLWIALVILGILLLIIIVLVATGRGSERGEIIIPGTGRKQAGLLGQTSQRAPPPRPLISGSGRSAPLL